MHYTSFMNLLNLMKKALRTFGGVGIKPELLHPWNIFQDDSTGRIITPSIIEKLNQKRLPEVDVHVFNYAVEFGDKALTTEGEVFRLAVRCHYF